jgi:hypothetical protein
MRSMFFIEGRAHTATRRKARLFDSGKAAELSSAAELNDPTARASFFAAVNTIGSDGDRAAVLRNVLREPKLGPETVADAIDSATAMGADGDKASVLLLAAERHASNPAIRAVLEGALKSVHSDDDCGWRLLDPATIRFSD